MHISSIFVTLSALVGFLVSGLGIAVAVLGIQCLLLAKKALIKYLNQ